MSNGTPPTPCWETPKSTAYGARTLGGKGVCCCVDASFSHWTIDHACTHLRGVSYQAIQYLVHPREVKKNNLAFFLESGKQTAQINNRGGGAVAVQKNGLPSR